MLPQARINGLLSQQSGDELVLYDTQSHKAHYLGPVAARVWQSCDGHSSAEQIAQQLVREGFKIDAGLLAMVMDRLGKRGLLQCQMPCRAHELSSSRRELARRVLAAGGITALLAITVVAPTAARSQSVGGCSSGAVACW